jgi:NTE family protein
VIAVPLQRQAAPQTTLTPHARGQYVPNPGRARYEYALCLSGGGFRASLFHLGAVRRLYEIGLLQRMDAISAVSGGTVIAAFLADRCAAWRDRQLSTAEWEREIAQPFRAFVSRNLNTIPVLRGWLPWNWTRNTGVEALAAACEARGLTTQTMATLPAQPQFMFDACDLVAGKSWSFTRTDSPKELADLKVATAVSVSSCLPGFFRPYTRSAPQRIALMDGGIVDNRALEPVWTDARHLLISDGGDVLQLQWGQSILWSLIRSAAVLWNQSQVVQKRWIISGFDAGQLLGTYWGISSSPMHYEQKPGTDAFPGYSPALARDVIARIRTDYDAFSDAEAAVLENHGYFMVEAAARAHLPQLQRSPLRAPHPAWMNETKIRAALWESGLKKFLGRW